MTQRLEGNDAREAVTREQLMVTMRESGATLGAIGAEFGVSRERVRQIILAAGGPTLAEYRKLKSAKAEAAKTERRSAIETAVRVLLESRGAISGAEAAEILGESEREVVKCWPPEAAHLLIKRGGGGTRTWNDEDIIETLRAAAVYEFPLTANAYAELVRVGEVHGPSLPSVHQRFGSWRTACDLAGVEPGQPLRGGYASRWTDEELLDFVKDYLLDPQWPHSASGFDEWRRVEAPDAPSFQTIRKRFGTWSNAKRLAMRPGGSK